MSTARGIRNRPGFLGSFEFEADGTVEFMDYNPDRDVTQITFIVRVDQAGTLSFYRIDFQDEPVLMVPVQEIEATTEDAVYDFLYRPFSCRGMRVVYENTSSDDGTITIDVTDNRRSG